MLQSSTGSRLFRPPSSGIELPRTGFRSSQMINTYRRTARTYSELGLGELTPMVEAIPEPCVPFEKARATNTEAAGIARLSKSLGGPSRTRTWSQWIKNPSKASLSVTNGENTGEEQCPIATDQTSEAVSKPLPAFSRSTLIASLYDHASALARAGDIEAARVAHEAAGKLLQVPAATAVVVDLSQQRRS